MIDFTKLKSMTIPEGEVSRLLWNGNVLWQKSGLPREYKKVEYIESSGKQYFDTGYFYQAGDIVTIVLSPLEYGVDDIIFGANVNGRCVFGIYNSAWRGNVSSVGVAVVPYTTGQVYTAQLKTDRMWYVDGEPIGSDVASIPTASMIFFAGLYPQGIVCQTAMRGYSLTVERAGVLIHDLVPCYRKSDRKPGMYDQITGTFFTNAGTGDFTFKEM